MNKSKFLLIPLLGTLSVSLISCGDPVSSTLSSATVLVLLIQHLMDLNQLSMSHLKKVINTEGTYSIITIDKIKNITLH